MSPDFIGAGVEKFSSFRNDTEISTSVKITNGQPAPAPMPEPAPEPVTPDPEPMEPEAEDKLDQDIKDDTDDAKQSVDAIESLWNMAQNHIILQSHINKTKRLDTDMYAFVDATMQFRAQAARFGYNTPSLEAFSPNSAMHRRAVMEASQGTFANIKQRIIEFLKKFMATLKDMAARFVSKIMKSDMYVNHMIRTIESSGLQSVDYNVLGDDKGRYVPKSDALKSVITEMKTLATTTTLNALTAALKTSDGQSEGILQNIGRVKQLVENFRQHEDSSPNSEYLTPINADPQYASAQVVIELLKSSAEILKSHTDLEKFLKSVEGLIQESINDTANAGDEQNALKIAQYRAKMINEAVRGLLNGYMFVAGTVSTIAGLFLKAVSATKKSGGATQNAQTGGATESLDIVGGTEGFVDTVIQKFRSFFTTHEGKLQILNKIDFDSLANSQPNNEVVKVLNVKYVERALQVLKQNKLDIADLLNIVSKSIDSNKPIDQADLDRFKQIRDNVIGAIGDKPTMVAVEASKSGYTPEVMKRFTVAANDLLTSCGNAYKVVGNYTGKRDWIRVFFISLLIGLPILSIIALIKSFTAPSQDTAKTLNLMHGYGRGYYNKSFVLMDAMITSVARVAKCYNIDAVERLRIESDQSI